MLREEFSWKCFALRFHRVDAFCTAQWRWPGLAFVVFRLVMAAYAVFAFTHILVATHATVRILAFLTIWSYLVVTLFFLTGAALAVFYYIRPHHFRTVSAGESSDPKDRQNTAFDGRVYQCSVNTCENTASVQNCGTQRFPSQGFLPETIGANLNGRSSVVENNQNVYIGSLGRLQCRSNTRISLPWYVQFHWALGNVIQVFAPIVTVIYFGALYPSARHIIGDAKFYDINIHGLNTAMVLIDVAVSARPVRLLHALYPILYGSVYIIFSVIFWAEDPVNNVLYPNVLDWNQPGISTGVVIGLAVIGIPFLQLAIFGLYQLRLKLHQVVYSEPYL